MPVRAPINRPLYGNSAPFRVDGGDRPEFAFYLPGRGGNLRLAILSGGRACWLDEAAVIEARYRAGMLLYQIRDPRLGTEPVQVTALATRDREGLLLEVAPPFRSRVETGAPASWPCVSRRNNNSSSISPTGSEFIHPIHSSTPPCRP